MIKGNHEHEEGKVCDNKFEQYWQGSVLKLGTKQKAKKIKGGKKVVQGDERECDEEEQKCKIDIIVCCPGQNLIEFDGTEVWVDLGRKIKVKDLRMRI